MQDHLPLGDLLIAKGKLTEQQLETALLARRGQKRRLGDVLVSMGYVSENDIAESLGEQYDLALVDALNLIPDPMALRVLGTDDSLNNRILPLRFVDDCIECVIADPIDVDAMNMITRSTNKRVVYLIAPISALLEAIRCAYGLSEADRRKTSIKNRRIARLREERGSLIDLIDDELSQGLVVPVSIGD